MNTDNATPGTWTIYNSSDQTDIKGNAHANAGLSIAVLKGPDRDANAALIAKAKVNAELVEELMDALRQITNCFYEYSRTNEGIDNIHFIEADAIASDAIQKAQEAAQ